MMKKMFFLILPFLAILVALYLTPKYKMYKQFIDWEDFTADVIDICSNFDSYQSAFFEYPTSIKDSVFQEILHSRYGSIPNIYREIYMYNDTLTFGGKQQNVIKLFLKGPNYRKKNIGCPINSFNYTTGLISPVKMSFFKFLFQKGDILIGILPPINNCKNVYYRTFLSYKEKNDLDFEDIEKSFSSTISPIFYQKYGIRPFQIPIKFGNYAYICYEAKLQMDTLVLIQKCEPFDGEYDTSSMIELINEPLYNWANEVGLHHFYFSIEVIPDFFEKKGDTL